MSISEPLADLIVFCIPFILIGKAVFVPSNKKSISSKTNRFPIDQAEKLSEYVDSIEIWNSLNASEVFVGIPAFPPGSIVKISP